MTKNKVLYNEGWTCCVDGKVFVSMGYLVVGMLIGAFFGFITAITFFIN